MVLKLRPIGFAFSDTPVTVAGSEEGWLFSQATVTGTICKLLQISFHRNHHKRQI